VRLVGFRGQLAAIDRLVEQVAAGTGGWLVITGPPGAGKSALLTAATEAAAGRGLAVVRLTGADGPETAEAAAETGPRLLLIDDIDRSADQPVHTSQLVALLTSHPPTSAVGVIATARAPVGLPPELRLPGLTEPELYQLLPTLPATGIHAVWLASGGRPGLAISLAGQLTGLDDDTDPVVYLALVTPSNAGFLDVDMGLVRLLETAVQRWSPPAARARLLAKLARELLGDPTSGARRRALIDEAVALSRTTGEPGTIAEVLENGLHALWDPAAAEGRLATASEIVELARAAGDGVTERRGLFWRFIALAELGRLDEAEAGLMSYARAGELAGDAEAEVIVLARR
jgi:hypothetical protein